MSIKLGNLDVESFKVGSGECSIYLGTTLLYSGGTPPAPHDYSQDYLTVRALGSGDVKWSGSRNGTTINKLSYSTDGGSTWSTPSSSITISVNSGDTVLFKGECTPISRSPYGIGKFSGTTASFVVEGNPMSLLYGDDFSGQTSLSGKNYAFYDLFSSCVSLVSAENLSLPATTLAYACYYAMFSSCSNLATAPELLATTLAEQCYQYMFFNCSSLETAPELQATILSNRCYRHMFRGCTSLTTAPELPATTLTTECYYWMFYGCTSLSSITCLATDIYATSCTKDWVSGVAASGTFTTPSSTSWTTGNNGIPNGWTRVDYSS